jgi:hypothetical protein
MRRLIGVSLTVALSMSTLAATTAMARGNHRTGVELEFNGVPTRHAFINFNQNARGDLRVVVKLWKVPEGADHWYVEVWCGDGHGAYGTPLDRVGYWPARLVTNARGNGNSGALWVRQADLAAGCGAGTHTGHVDVGQVPNPDPTEYTSPVGGVVFTVQ